MSTEGFEPSPLARSESQISLAKLTLESDALDHSAKLTDFYVFEKSGHCHGSFAD